MAISYQHLAPLAAFLWAMALLFPPTIAQAQEAATKVLVIANKQSPELQNLLSGMRSTGKLSIDVHLAIPTNICASDALVVAYGSETAAALSDACPGKSMVILAQSYNLHTTSPKLASGSWGYYMDQPITSQARHASMNMPSIRTLGILYNDDDINKDEIERLAKENLRIKIQLVKVQKGQVVAQIMRDLYQSVDAVLITGNPDIWSLSDFKTYLVLGMRQGKIMIGGFNYIFMNRGSISAVHSDFYAMGQDIAKKIESNDHLYGISFFRKRQIVTNDLLAARYGIYIGTNNEW